MNPIFKPAVADARSAQREDVQLAFLARMEAFPVPRLLALMEVASALNASPSTTQQLVAYGELAFVQIGKGTERTRLAFS
ncbi:hypothetical protein SAMN05216228_101227 [Rhizobium tibeticum]|uniref:Uncharacterized protein n=2 Tax=Rhizobium tibeticum TaxID=501024 RepID=A0A1H8M698_9HYPH|nr:hypothetical protein RTCCBAU85039_3216 [Rhizobium tibeticum]SEO12666.1 hypothetical protein SAMN05216228_101227 [Rhizobium tibeticum]